MSDNALGSVIYLRTYSRFREDLGRRENWDETVDRVVKFSSSLGPMYPGEDKDLYDTIYAMRGFPAGRTLWVGGTEFSYQNGQSQYNCAFMSVESIKDFYDMMVLLMSGTGVGFGVTHDQVKLFNREYPIIRHIDLTILPYTFVGYGSPDYTEHTSLYVQDGKTFLVVGDSREGWAEAVRAFISLYVSDWYPNQVVVSVNSVRPHGERLKTFGGYASGPDPLIEFFLFAKQVIERPPNGWTSTKLLDLMNLIGRATVAGGSRRSAQIAIGSPDDMDFIDAKTGDWWNSTPWRTQSNNSVIFEGKPDKDFLQAIFERIMQYGEPGIVNAVTARQRHPHFKGLNPCAEQLLDNHGVCNLSTIVLPRHVVNGKLDTKSLERTARLLTRHALRITNVKFPPSLAEWQAVQDRDRLIGISFTGYGDLVDLLNLGPKDQAELLKWLRSVVHDEAKNYAYLMGVPEPVTKTSVKPEGTISLLPGVSSGIHYPFAPYYIRRVRISSMDAVAQALRALGMEPKPEVGFSSLEEAHTWVFEFPVKTPAKRPSKAVSAVEQLERYKLALNSWADANVSITVYVDPAEKGQVIDWLMNNWDHYVAVSFLPKDDSVYPLMPFEQINEKQYRAMVKSMPDLSLLKLEVDRIEQLAGFMADDDLDPSCATGLCPVR